MKSRVRDVRRPEMVGDLGGFAGLFALDVARYRRPLLATSTDGVGTKVAIAQAMDRHDTIGVDLVAMVADDLVVCGAEPLVLQDYIACGKVVPERISEIVGGIAEGCRQAGCALSGGETAEHPVLMPPDAYDLSGTGVGIVESDAVLGANRVHVGDVVLAMGSSGVHANGYSLVRHVLLGLARMRLDTHVDELGRTLGEELIEPTRIYARACLAVLSECDVHAFAHVTGGGLAGNLARVLPPHVDATIDRASWRPQPIFDLVARRGRVSPQEMERTFNMGVGMVAVVAPDDVDRAQAVLMRYRMPTWPVGEIIPARAKDGQVALVGKHPT